MQFFVNGTLAVLSVLALTNAKSFHPTPGDGSHHIKEADCDDEPKHDHRPKHWHEHGHNHWHGAGHNHRHHHHHAHHRPAPASTQHVSIGLSSTLETSISSYLGAQTTAQQTSSVQTSSVQTSSVQTSSVQTSSVQTSSMQTSSVQTSTVQASADQTGTASNWGRQAPTPAAGLPIQVESSQYLCDVHSDFPVSRDLGFVGKVQDTMIFTYGDTETTTDSFYMTHDSSSIGTEDPCSVINTQLTSDGSHVDDMLAPNSDWGEDNVASSFGGTNVLPTSGYEGMMFFLKMQDEKVAIGAGVAHVTLSDDAAKNVTTSRLAAYWWDASKGEPWYGDIGAYNDGTYVYGYGHGGQANFGGSVGSYAYIARAAIANDDWTDVGQWQYYDGSTNTWSSNRLYNPTPDQSIQWNTEEGPASGVGQGQMIWSNYYQKIMWVYGQGLPEDAAGNWAVYARTADVPEGPWSSATTLYTVQRSQPDYAVYCMVANPWFDESGKTLIVTVDNGAGTVQATRVSFA